MRELILPLAASLALNTFAVTSVQRAFTGDYQNFERIRREQRLAAEKDKIFFDFVESPELERAQKPERAKKISDRDSVSRDALTTRPVVTDGPKIKNPGPADQLEQLQKQPGQMPLPPSAASQAMRKAPAAQPTTETPDEARAEKPAQTAPKPEPAKEEDEGQILSKEDVVVPGKTQPTSGPEPQVSVPMRPAPADSSRQAASPAQAGTARPAGRDNITTQEMSKARQRGARLSGQTSFDAMGSDMGVYMKNLKEKVWLAWFPYLSFQYPTDYQGAHAVLSIMIDPKGEVKSVRVLESTGSPQFTEFCMVAVQKASSFGPLPPEVLVLLGKDQIEIKFAFHYR